MESPTPSLDEGAYDLDDDEHTHQPSEWDYTPDGEAANFDSDVRQIFAEFFVEHFSSYEKFIIMPKQSYQQWQKNREQFQNFDKTAYISDQPQDGQAFYSAFLETSIFTIFADSKIVAVYQPEKCERSLAMFDMHVERYLDKSGLAKAPPTPGYRTTSTYVCACVYVYVRTYMYIVSVRITAQYPFQFISITASSYAFIIM